MFTYSSIECQGDTEWLSAIVVMVTLSYPNIEVKGIACYSVCFLTSLLYLCYAYNL